MQEEVQSLALQRDQLRTDLAAVETERDRLSKEVDRLKLVVKERDQLREQLSLRTAERDQTLGQLDQIRQSIRSLMEQVEAALPAEQPSVGSSKAGSENKS